MPESDSPAASPEGPEGQDVAGQPKDAEEEAKLSEFVADRASIARDPSQPGCCSGNGTNPSCGTSCAGCCGVVLNPLCGLCGGGVTPLALGVDEHLHAAAKSTAPGSRAAASSIASKWATSHERVTHAAAGAALAVHIVGLTSTLADPYVQHPLIRMTVIDECTGHVLRRPLWLPQQPQQGLSPHVPVAAAGTASHGALGGTQALPRVPPRGLCGGDQDPNAFAPNAHSARACVAYDYTPPQSTAPTAISVTTPAPEHGSQDAKPTATEVPAVWDETLVLPDDARVYLRAGVVLLFEVFEWGLRLPRRLLQQAKAGSGVYAVGWGYLRPVAPDGTCHAHMAPLLKISPPGTTASGAAHTTRRRSAATGSAGIHQRSQLNPTMELLSQSNGIPQLLTAEEAASMGGIPPGDQGSDAIPVLPHFGLGLAYARAVAEVAKDQPLPHQAEEGQTEAEALPEPGTNARHLTPAQRGKAGHWEGVYEVARPPLLRVRMHRWLTPTWQERQAALANTRSTVFEHVRSQDYTGGRERAVASTVGPKPGLLGMQCPPVVVQYRMRRRVEAGYNLGIQLAAVQPWWLEPAEEQESKQPAAGQGQGAADAAILAHSAAGVVDDWAAAGVAARMEEEAWSDLRFNLRHLDAEAASRLMDGGAAGGGAGGGGQVGDGTDAGGAAGEREAMNALVLRQRRARDPCLPPVRHFRALPAGSLGCMAVAFSPSGEYVAVGASDRSGNYPIFLYEPGSGRRVSVLTGHTGLVYHLQWRGDGAMLASASADGSAMVWNILGSSHSEGEESDEPDESKPAAPQAGRARGRRAGQRGAHARHAAPTPSVANRELRKGPLEPHLVACLLHRPPVFVYGVAWHPHDDSVLVTSAFDGKVRLWTFSHGDAPERSDRRGRAEAADEDTDDDVQVAERGSSSLKVQQARQRGVFLGALGTDWSPGGRTPAPPRQGSGAGVPLSPMQRQLKGRGPQGPHGAHVNAVTFDTRGKRMFTADAAGVVVVWDVPSQRCADVSAYSVRRRQTLPGLEGRSIVALAPHPTLSQLALLAHGNVLRLVDTSFSTLPLVRTFPGVRCSSSHLALAFSPDGGFLAAGSEDGEVGVWEVDSGLVVEGAGQAGGARSLYIMGFGRQLDVALNAVAWHPNEHMVALGAFGGGNPVMLYVNDTGDGRLAGL